MVYGRLIVFRSCLTKDLNQIYLLKHWVGSLEGSHNGIATVLKTVEVTLIRVRPPYPPQGP